MNLAMTRDRSIAQRWAAGILTALLAAAALVVTVRSTAHAALTPETTIPVGDFPASVAVSPDGTTVYVTRILDDTLSVIDTSTNTVIDTVTVGHRPDSVAVSPDGTTVYTANSLDDTLSVIDTSTNTVIATVTVGDDPDSVAVSPDGTTVYTANFSDDTLSVIDAATKTVIGTVTVGDGPRSVAVSPDGTTVYVANSLDDTLSVIDTSTMTVIDTVTVGDDPVSVAVSPDGTTVYTANSVDDTVSVIDTSTMTVIGTVTVGDGPRSVAVSPDGTTVYVANTFDGTLSVIDTSTMTVIDTVTVGGGSRSVAVSPDGTTVYTANSVDDTVSVLREVPSTYTVTFAPNGGTGVMSPQTANTSTPLVLNAFTREGYTFTGWNTAADGTGTSYADGANYAFTADATLYAQWDAVEYVISYDLAGGIAGTPANPVTYTVESAPITLTPPTRDGFTFAGWTGTGLTEPTVSVTIPTGTTGDRAFTATWEANPAATLVITGPTTVTELDTNSFTVEAFDAHGISLGDVTGHVTFTGADTTGTGLAFPVDFSAAGQTTTRTLTATLDTDPSVTGTLDVQVVSAITGITVTAPATAAEGDTITVHVTATGATGSLGDATAYAVITSDVSTDVVDGAEVSFPTASPHTLTITLGALTATHTVDVTPAATGGLPTTGANLHWGLPLSAGLLLALGAALTITNQRRRRHS